MSSPSIIENKIKEKTNENKKEKSNWGRFALSILNNFILTTFISVLGSNFIFFSTLNNLEYFLPTKKESYYDDKFSFFGKRMSQFKQAKQHNEMNKEVNVRLLNKLGIGDIKGWPYSLYKKQFIPSISQSFLNWFSSSTAEAYMTQRKILQTIIGFFSPDFQDKDDKNLFSSQPLQIILTPFITLFGSLIVPFIAFIITIVKLFTNKHGGFIYSFVGLFLLYTWFISYAVSTLQTIQYILTLMLVPLISNYREVLKTIYNNRGFIGFLFGALVVISAFSHLELVFSLVGLCIYIILLLSYVFTK